MTGRRPRVAVTAALAHVPVPLAMTPKLVPTPLRPAAASLRIDRE
jgi:hypothetical protein